MADKAQPDYSGYLGASLSASGYSEYGAAFNKFKQVEDVVFVDVGEKVIDSNVIRDGLEVGVFELDHSILDDIIVGPAVRQVVVRQSIPPGTPVAVGTAVNLTMAPTVTFPAGVITGVLDEVKEVTLGDLHQQYIKGRPETISILAKVGPGDVLPARDEERLIAIFAEEGIEIGEGPGKDVNAAIATLRAANTFGV